MPGRDIIVIAGSAGAVQEIRVLLATLPGNFGGSLFIVVHTSPDGPALLADILDRTGPLPAKKPYQGEAVKPGQVYVAPPDHHMRLSDGHIHLDRGPRENNFRPAADPLFRSAAEAFGQRVVGIVLSGGMSDGALGLQSIKAHGGIAIVQRPEEALYPSMPENARRAVDVDYVLSTGAMSAVLEQLAGKARHGGSPMKSSRSKKRHVSTPGDSGGPAVRPPLEGPPSSFICPECGGALWELENGGLLHYRCHVGHAYAADALVDGQDKNVEDALWVALRTLEETAALRRRLADQARSRGMHTVADGYEERAKSIEQRAGVISEVLAHDNLPPNLRGYGSSKHSRFLKNQDEKSAREKRHNGKPSKPLS